MWVQRYADLDALADGAANELTRIARDAIATRGTFSLALSGGGTPKRLFEVLATRGRAAFPWDATELWWGDERTVPPDHADSNYRMAVDALAPLALDPARIHRMRGEDDPAAAAAAYERALIAAYGDPPVLDYVLLGMGPDGHTASLFPLSPGLAERRRWVIANPVDAPLAGGQPGRPAWRITFTFPMIAAARYVRFLVSGGTKAAALADVLEGPPGRYPAQSIRGANLAWLVDDAAAARLTTRSLRISVS